MYGIDWKREPNVERLQRSFDLLETDPTTAVSELQELAESGSIASMWYLGDAYSYGRSIAKDLGKAEYWYSRAEKAGWTPASYLLGRALESSNEYESAFKAFSRGSQKNYLPAIYRLAKSYEYGFGTSKNVQECVRLLEVATGRGHLFAKRDLAGFYLRGSFGPARLMTGLWLLTSLAFDMVHLTFIRAWKRSEYEERILA